MYTKDFRLKQAEKRISKLKEKSFELSSHSIKRKKNEKE